MSDEERGVFAAAFGYEFAVRLAGKPYADSTEQCARRANYVAHCAVAAFREYAVVPK